MKQSIFTLILIFFFQSVYAGGGLQANIQLEPAAAPTGPITLKAILVIVDGRAGDPISQSTRLDLAVMQRMLELLQNRKICNVETNLLQGSKATLYNIQQAVKNTNAYANDVTLFYFSGHGGMVGGDRMFLNTHDDQALYRDDLEKTINAQKARMKIIITDACNNSSDGVAPSSKLTSARAGGMNPDNDVIYQQLFTGYKGLLSIASSSPGQYSFSNDELGGFFTHYFVRETLLKNPSPSWEVMFKTAKEKTAEMMRRISEGSTDPSMAQTPRTWSLPAVLGGQDPIEEPVVPTYVYDGVPILITNQTNKTVTVTLDNNLPNTTWSSTKVSTQKIAPNKAISIKQEITTIGYTAGVDKVYYDLEPGNYFFDTDGKNELALFAEGTENITDYSTVLSGTTWAWESPDGGITQTTFEENGNYIDVADDGSTADGVWLVEVVDIEGEPQIVLHIYEGEGDEQKEYVYLVQFDDNFETAQVVFSYGTEHGEIIPEDQYDPEVLNSVMILHKQQ